MDVQLSQLMKFLREARESKGITQQQIATELGVKNNTISNYENCISEPSIDAVSLMCKIYGLNISDVLNKFYGQDEKTFDYPFSDEAFRVAMAYDKAEPRMKEIVLTALDLANAVEPGKKIELKNA